MAKKKDKRPANNRPKRVVPTDCFFCTQKITPDYKDYQTLEKFLTDRKKILGRSRSGICSRHQRILSKSIKRARHLALIPFTATAR